MAELKREDWVSLGENLKAAHRGLLGARRHTAELGKAHDKKVVEMLDALSVLRNDLDNLVCKEHSNWESATKVFYGEQKAEVEPTPDTCKGVIVAAANILRRAPSSGFYSGGKLDKEALANHLMGANAIACHFGSQDCYGEAAKFVEKMNNEEKRKLIEEAISIF